MGKVADDLDHEYFGDWEPVLAVDDQNSLPNAWTRARNLILDSEDISDEERDLLRSGSLKTLTQDLADLEDKNRKESRFRRFVAKTRLKPLLDGLVNLDQIINPVAHIDPHMIAPVIWGGLRVIILAIKALVKFPEDLVDFLNRIGWTLSRLQIYENVSVQSVRLTRILVHVLVKYLSLCLYFRDSFVKSGKPRKNWAVTLSFGSESFKGTITQKIAEIDKLCVNAHEEAYLALTRSLLEKVTGFRQAFDDNISDGQKTEHEARIKEQRESDLKHAKSRFLEWLRHFPTHEDLNRLQREKLEGTCEWISDDRLISTWLRGQSQGTSGLAPSLLWMSGGAGSGKTVLSAHIIGQIQHIHPTAYFFCKSDDPRTQTTVAILQNWIWQLVHRSPVLPSSITAPSDEHQSPSVTALKTTIIGLQQHLKRSYLVVDGLDECTDEPLEFLDCCQTLSQKWSILIISRDIPNIRDGLKQGNVEHKALTSRDNSMDIDTMVIHKAISVGDTAEDIDKFVNQRTERLASSKGWQSLQRRIAHVLYTTAEGMFLWVRLMLDLFLEDATLEGDVEDILNSIPSDLYGFYDQIMCKMKANRSRWKIAQRALHWVVYSFRPLSVGELHAVIAFESNRSNSIDNFKMILQSSCGLLLRIDEISGKINLIHATVKEYLLQSKDISMIEKGADAAHGFSSMVCLNYLCDKIGKGLPVDRDMQKSEQYFQNHLGNAANQFLDYSTIYWCQHVNKSLQQSASWETSLHKLLCDENLTVNWLQLFQYSHSWGRPGADETANIIHMALHPDAEKTPFCDVLDHSDLTSFRQHVGLGDGRRFLRWDRFLKGAGDLPYCFPIILIGAHFNYVDIIHKELRKRVGVETKSHRGGTALLWAARGDSINAVRLLLAKGANPNDQSRFKQVTALAKAIYLEAHLTSFQGTYPVVQVLLDGKADPTLKDRDQLSLLNTLIISSHEDSDGEVALAKQLTKYSPGLWTQSHEIYGTILRHAIAQNRPRIANAILEEIGSQNPEALRTILTQRYDQDALLHLAVREQPSLVPILVAHGASLTELDARRVSPLCLAARYDRGDAIKTFLDHGLAVDDKSLIVALESQSMEAISVLLDNGVTANVPESLILLPRTTELDSRLASTGAAALVSVRDIYHIAFHFKEFFYLPIPLTARILDFAELWVQSSTMRDEGNFFQPYDKDDTLTHRMFLRSAPVVGRTVQKIAFTIQSHDQGFCDDRLLGPWTWFECWRQACGDTTKLSPWPNYPVVVYNRVADWSWQKHQITWLNSDNRDGWKALRVGDRICVLAQARYAAWVNYVHDMRIDIYVSILRHNFTKGEILEIWETFEKHIRPDGFHPNPERLEKIAIPHRSLERSRLQILAAEYGTLNITDTIRELVIDNHSLRLDRSLLPQFFGRPWSGTVDVVSIQWSLSFIYQFGDDDPQLFMISDGIGTLFIEPGTSGSKVDWATKPLGLPELILAIIWGNKECKTPKVYDIFNRAIAEKGELLINVELFGEDPWVGIFKSCVVYSRKEDGTVVCRAAMDETIMRFKMTLEKDVLEA